MLTLREIVLEQDTAIKKSVEACRKQGVSYLNRYTADKLMSRSNASSTSLTRLLHDEFGIEMVYNDSHYILSRGELRRDF